MPDFEVAVVPTVWKADPVLFATIIASVALMVLIITILVRKELKHEKNK